MTPVADLRVEGRAPTELAYKIGLLVSPALFSRPPSDRRQYCTKTPVAQSVRLHAEPKGIEQPERRICDQVHVRVIKCEAVTARDARALGPLRIKLNARRLRSPKGAQKVALSRSGIESCSPIP